MVPLIMLLLCCAGVLVSSVPERKKMHYSLELAEHHFDHFVKKYNKLYENEMERSKRYQIFKENLEKINQKNKNKHDHAEFGINKFSDISHEEFKKTYGCNIMAKMTASPCSQASKLKNERAPEEFDWRKQNKVTRVKNQGNCGSCWSFSATGTLEGAYAIKHNELKEFSEQQLVDCDHTSYGCDGGLMSNALLYFKANGAELEKDYPYIGNGSQCHFDQSKVAAKVLDCYQHDPKAEEDLKQILVQYGPLAIAVDATDLMLYKSGVMAKCASNQVDHGVLLVGYGTENNVPYWIVKNSWDTNWGEQGYFRIKRNINACNIMSHYTVSPKLE